MIMSWCVLVWACLFTHVYELDELCSDLKCTVDHVVLSSSVAHTYTAWAVKHSLRRDAVWEMERAPARTLQPLICFRVLLVRGRLLIYLFFILCSADCWNWCDTQYRGGTGNGLPGNGFKWTLQRRTLMISLMKL